MEEAKGVAAWSVDEVYSFILSLGGNSAKYASTFRDQQVSGGLLLELEASDLEELGVNNALHKKKILKAVRKAASIPVKRQPGEAVVPGEPKRQPEMSRLPSEGVSDTPQATLKSALAGCLLITVDGDEESVMFKMSQILGYELSPNDKQFIRVELSKKSGKDDEILKQDPSLPGSSPPAPPPPVPAGVAPGVAGDIDLIQENSHLKDVIQTKDKTIAKLKKKIETLIRTQLEDITDMADENTAGRSALQKSTNQLNMLQEQLNMKHQSFEETISNLKQSQLSMIKNDEEIAQLKQELAEQQGLLQSTLLAKDTSEQRILEFNSTIEMMQEEMEAELNEQEEKVTKLQTELDNKSEALVAMVTQNVKLQQEAANAGATSEELEKTKTDLADFRERVAKLTAELDELKQILKLKNSDISQANARATMAEKEAGAQAEKIQSLEGELMTHKALSSEAAVKGKELEEVKSAKEIIEAIYAQSLSQNTQLTQAIAMKDIKIAELNQEVSTKNEELQQRNTELSAQVNAMVTLTQQKMKAEQELAETESKLASVEAGFDANKAQLEAQLIALTEAMEEMSSEHENILQEKTNMHTAHLFAKNTELNAVKDSLKETKDAHELLEKTVVAMNTESSGKSDKIAALQMELQQKASVEEALSEENEGLSAQVTGLQRTVASLSTETQQKNQQLGALQSELTQKETVEEALSEENEAQATQIKNLSTQLNAKIQSEAKLTNDLNTERALRQSELDHLKGENASLKRQIQEMQSTVQALSESAAQQEEDMTTQIKSLRGTVAQSQADLLSTQTLMTQHKIQADSLRKDLEESKSISSINLMQKDEIISNKSNSLTQLKGEYESLKTIIKEMNEGNIRSRERHQQEMQANQLQLNEKEQQISKLQKSIREFAEKAKTEQQSLREQLSISRSETNDARRQVQESTERYQRANQEMRARQREVAQLKQVIQAQTVTIQSQNKALGT